MSKFFRKIRVNPFAISASMAVICVFINGCAGPGKVVVFENATDVGRVQLAGSMECDRATGDYKITGGGFNILFLAKKIKKFSICSKSRVFFATYMKTPWMWRQNGVMNVPYLLRFLNMVRLPKPSNKSVAGSGTVSLS